MALTIKEFNETVIRSEDTIRLTYDVRPFGTKQGEAVDCYLQEIGRAILRGGFETSKSIVVMYERGTVFPISTSKWLSQVRALGVPMNLQEADS
jgi:hypothetical protein